METGKDDALQSAVRKPDPRLYALRGHIAEELLAVTLMRGSKGKTAVARPVVDLGFDGYARRVGTLRVVPYQVKSKRSLANGMYHYGLRPGDILPDPNGAVLFTHVTLPSITLFPRLFVIPVSEFLARCRISAHGNRIFSTRLSGDGVDPWKEFLVHTDRLQEDWLERIHGWNDDLPALPQPFPNTGFAPAAADDRERSAVSEDVLRDRHYYRLHGRRSETLVAGLIQSVARHRLVVARDRIRLDTVSLLLHSLDTFKIAGLSVQTGFINPDAVVPFKLKQTRLFVDPQLWVVIVICEPDGGFRDPSLLIPSAAIPRLMPSVRDGHGLVTFVDQIPIDNIPLRYRPYVVPTRNLGEAILKRVFDARNRSKIEAA